MEKGKELLNKIVEWWKKFSTKQRAAIISVIAVVLVALGILYFVSSRPTMQTLITCENTAQASEVKELLDGEGIKYEIAKDNLTFMVDAKDDADAVLLLGSNDIPAANYDIDNVFDGGFSATESDKTKKYQLYLEEDISAKLETLANVKSAKVTLSIPEDDGTINATKEETYASVILELEGKMEEEQAAGLANYIATAVGNKSTDNILIMDSDTNVLFSGGDSSDPIGTASTTQQTYKNKEEKRVKSEVKDVMLGSDVYDNIEVGMNLVLDFDRSNVTTKKYSIPENRDEGYLTTEKNYEATTEGGTAAVPGTDTNQDDTTYMTQDGTINNSTVTDNSKEHALDEEVTNTEKGIGSIKYDESSLTVVATKYKIYNEDALKNDGTLDKMTFDEFKAANEERKKTDVDEEFYTAVANATGFSQDNISIIAYEVPFFQYSDNNGFDVKDYLPIILAVLIFAMLGFVVFKSTRKEAVAEPEPELSVEDLLETTKEVQEPLEDIGFNDKSEARIQIEKFVDENPEAVASLLRNWLNEEWE
ncbi:MAG: flagellar basal-body MS-ring/collar protein FliF [Lachnospiraceae bacterium]